jgi:hypothetical protein
VDASDSKKQRLIWLKVAAPAKPLLGQTCNGCGVCCTAEPCPVARVFLWQWRGSCRALMWIEAGHHYRCGMLLQPSSYLRILPVSWQAGFSRLVARWIAAGTACDSDAEV